MSSGGVVLVAAGGLARETLVALRAGGSDGPDVVLDDDAERWGGSLAGAPIVGGLEDVKRYDDHAVVVCAGKGSARRELVRRLAELGVGPDRFASVIHPLASVPDHCTVGAGSILLAGVVLTADVTLGSHVVAMPHVTFTHDDVVEDYATLAAGVSLGGGVHVGSGAYLGMNASVRENLTVGAGATLGMGAALLRDLRAGETWAGVPAGPIGHTDPGES
jgi:sugar O-acyltransferase (sialic acid O-acetyltransferase NeuD family)